MNYEQIKAKKNSMKGGTFHTITTKKQLKTLKNVSDIIEKTNKFSGRFGVQYDNLKSVKEGRANGELPSENQGLTWGEWLEYPYFIKHNDEIYVRVSLVDGTNFETQYYQNGNITTKDNIQNLCLKSNFNTSGEEPKVLTINIKNIESII